MFAGFGSQRAVKIKKIHYTCKLKFLKSAWYDRSLLRKLARKFIIFINKQSTTLC